MDPEPELRLFCHRKTADNSKLWWWRNSSLSKRIKNAVLFQTLFVLQKTTVRALGIYRSVLLCPPLPDHWNCCVKWIRETSPVGLDFFQAFSPKALFSYSLDVWWWSVCKTLVQEGKKPDPEKHLIPHWNPFIVWPDLNFNISATAFQRPFTLHLLCFWHQPKSPKSAGLSRARLCLCLGPELADGRWFGE